jgi:hypothetical protein
MEKKLENLGIGVGAIIVLLLVGALFVRVTFIDFVDNYEFGYRFNALTGEITELNQKGYIWSAPFITKIHKIDTRPFQVKVSANDRVLNAKLVQFDPKGYKLFISWHGRDDYDKMKLDPILTSYAFDPSQNNYPFLLVLKELKNEEKNFGLDISVEADSTTIVH